MADKLAQAKRNWLEWEAWFKKSTAFVALNGDPMYNSRKSWVLHTFKFIFYFIVFSVVFTVVHGRYPAFDKLTFVKVILWELVGESCGFCCSAGPVGGQFPHYFPLLWHNLTVGTCKRPTLSFLGGATRQIHDVLLFVVMEGLLIAAFLVCDENSIHHNVFLKGVFAIMVYFYFFDRTIFLSLRAEYYGMYLICIYFENGWLQGAQCLQIAVWFWAGISKLGIWFDYVYPRMQAGAPTTFIACGFDASKMTEYCKQFYRGWPLDLRPSGLIFAVCFVSVFLIFVLMCCVVVV